MTSRSTPKIVVERVSEQRVKDFHDAYVESLPELFLAGFISSPDPASEELGDWQDWIKAIDDGWENDKEYFFQIIDTGTNQVVGGVFLNHVLRQYQMANLGYWVRTSRTGSGIATEAARQVARYAFEQLGFQRLEIVVDIGNTPSLKIAQKLGAVREGLLRNRGYVHGTPHDAFMHSLIPSDFGIHKTA
jgi:ribosomal-protein-serine acetyltransferase